MVKLAHLTSSLRPFMNSRCLVIMLALSLTWFTLLSGLSFPVYLIPEPGRTHALSDALPLVFIGAMCATLCILRALGRDPERLSPGRKRLARWPFLLPALVGLCGAICMALCAVCAAAVAVVLAVTGASCLGFYGIATFAAWSAIARRELGDKAGALLAFSYAACCLLGLVGCLVNASAVVSTLAMPVLHVGLCLVLAKLPVRQQGDEGPSECVDGRRKPFFAHKTNLLIAENAVFLLVTVACMSVLDSVIFNMDDPVSTFSVERKAVIQVIGCLVFGLLACVLAVTRRHETASIVAVSAISLLNVGGTLVAPNLLDSYPLFASVPASTGIAGFQVLIMVLVFGGHPSDRPSMSRSCTLYMAVALCLPKLVALGLNSALGAAGVALARGDAFTLTKVAAFVMVVLTVTFLVGELCRSVSAPETPAIPDDGRKEEQLPAQRDPSTPCAPSCLSEREADVFRLLVAGYTTKAAGEKLFISKSTVETHAKRIYAKLDVHSKQELIEKYGARMQ